MKHKFSTQFLGRSESNDTIPRRILLPPPRLSGHHRQDERYQEKLHWWTRDPDRVSYAPGTRDVAAAHRSARAPGRPKNGSGAAPGAGHSAPAHPARVGLPAMPAE